MQDRGQHWEYIGTYVDDLAITSKDPLALTSRLETKYGFSLKGTGPITYHLGCDFIRDENDILCIQPKMYIEKMVATYKCLFGTKPKDMYTSPPWRKVTTLRWALPSYLTVLASNSISPWLE